jgi:hypothetical protein
MCWIPLGLGALMLVVGVTLLVRFFSGHGRDRPEIASQARTESMILGGLLSSIGLLLLILGIVAETCFLIGVS